MTTATYLDLSTAHLQQSTLNPAPHRRYLIAEYQEGAFFYVPSDDLDPDTPPDLAFILGYAKGLGCTIVRFDADSEKIEGLPIFDW